MEKLLKKLDYYKVSNMEAELEKRFGHNAANEIINEWNRLSDEADRSDNPGRQDGLYEFLNSSYELSMAVSCYTDGMIIRSFGKWLMEHKDYFGSRILDAGCGTGILSCLMAYIIPDAHITAADRSENCIKIARQIKEKLGVNNIDFINISAECIKDPEGFDTVFSARTFHENIRIRYTDNMFLPFSEQVKVYADIYREYCSKLSALIADGGHLVCIERNKRDTEFLGVLTCMNSGGLKLCRESMCELMCEESDFSEKSVFQTFVLEKGSSMPREELFEVWKSLAFSPEDDEEAFTRAQADYYTEENSGMLIEGYSTFDRSGMQLAKGSLIRHKNDDESFIMYQANVREAWVQTLPYEALKEAKEIFSQRKLIDRAMGFTVKEIQ